MIDPNQPDAKTQITYPKVLELLRLNLPGNAVEWLGAVHTLSQSLKGEAFSGRDDQF
jgi:hypothetical protein